MTENTNKTIRKFLSLMLDSFRYGKYIMIVGCFWFINAIIVTIVGIDHWSIDWVGSKGLSLIFIGLVFHIMNWSLKRSQRNSKYFGIKSNCCQDDEMKLVDEKQGLYHCVICNRVFTLRSST